MMERLWILEADVTETHLYFLNETHLNYVLNMPNELFHNKVFLLGFMMHYHKSRKYFVFIVVFT